MKSLVKASLRVALIFLFLSLVSGTITQIDTIVFESSRGTYHGHALVLLAEFIMITAIFIFTWWKTDSIVRLVTRGIDTSEQNLVVTASDLDLRSVIMRVLGLYLLIRSFPNIIGIIVNYFAENYLGSPGSVVYQVITFLIGLWLVLSGKGFARLLSTIWNLGMEEPKSPVND